MKQERLAIVALGCLALAVGGSWILWGAGLGLMVLAGAALVGAILLLWSSVNNLTGETELSLLDALSLAAPSAEEEQKRAVLRALKDLEYERSLGKISEEDFAELSARYRAQAKRLLRSLEEQDAPALKRAEARFEKRWKRHNQQTTETEANTEKSAEDSPTEAENSPPLPATGASETKGNNEDSHHKKPAPGETEKALVCKNCETHNDVDARFCKGCGEALSQSPKGETEHKAVEENV